MESLTQIEQRAAAWLAKRDGEEWNEADEAALQEWLRSATANRIAFLRIESAWEETLRLKALAAGLPAGAAAKTEWRLPVSFEDRPGDVRERRKKYYLAAACLLLTLLSASAYWGWTAVQGDRYSTPVGGMASVPLQDGSNITLNTASKIRIELSASLRYIDLKQGEAFFDVAKDPARPFVVSAGDKRITAIGTRFSVRREGERVRVVVVEGKVKVEDRESPASVFLLEEGAIAKAGESGIAVQKAPPLRAEELLSWRTGYLTFFDTPLADAVAEFNQYNEEQIKVSDRSAASILLTGKFKSNNSEAFVRLLEDGYGIHVSRLNGEIVLATRSHEGSDAQ